MSDLYDPLGKLSKFCEFAPGWDGNRGLPPSKAAVGDAAMFMGAAFQKYNALRFEPTLHSDGSVILELGDGSAGSFRFKGDGTVICCADGFPPVQVTFSANRLFLMKSLPPEVERILDRNSVSGIKE